MIFCPEEREGGIVGVKEEAETEEELQPLAEISLQSLVGISSLKTM